MKIRIGTDNKEEFEQLASEYFTADGVLKEDVPDLFIDFLTRARAINDTFRCYDDALNYILDQLDKQRIATILDKKYSNGNLQNLLKTKLYPYQEQGILFAARTGKSIIADEMGLGKTIQALGTAELLKNEGLITSVLILCPTSLKYQWKNEIERFTDSDVLVIEGNHLIRRDLYNSEPFYKIVSYNSACNDIKILKSLQTDLLIMDEVQRLKNWKTQISQAARHIQSEYSVILSGTPLENKLDELYSISQFVDQYCLGPFYKFKDKHIITSNSGKVIGYQNLNEIGKTLQKILIRRRKQDVHLQLPERMDKILFVPMTKEQEEIHEEYRGIVAKLVVKWQRFHFLSEKDRQRLLLSLSKMRMVSDSTYIIDQKTRYDTKIDELMSILTELFENGDEKVVVFSQWERMTRLVALELDKCEVRYEYLHGGVPSEKRKDLIVNFTNDPNSRVFISTDAGSTGLNLQAASLVINLDLPWNPAVLEQRIARIHRIGQKHNIQVINFVSKNTIEERMLTTLNFKSSLFGGILDGGEDSVFLENSKFDQLMHTVEDLTVSEAGEVTPTVDLQDFETPVADFVEPKNDPEKEMEKAEKPSDFMTSESADMGTVSSPQEVAPEQLLQQGFSFFAGLAKTLSSPEATQKLVSSIVEEDKETGKTSIRIPVSDKKSVENVLTMVGKLFAAMK